VIFGRQDCSRFHRGTTNATVSPVSASAPKRWCEQLAEGPKPGAQIEPAAQAAEIPIRSPIVAADALERMHQWDMAGGQNGDVLGHCAERRCPSKALERSGIEVGWSAISTPATHGQHAFHAGLVDRLRDLDRIGPVKPPGLWHPS
jgi:hypothetical protein